MSFLDCLKKQFNGEGAMECMMTPNEVAAYLSVSKSMVYQLMRSEGFPAFRVRKHWRTAPVLLREWVKKQR